VRGRRNALARERRRMETVSIAGRERDTGREASGVSKVMVVERRMLGGQSQPFVVEICVDKYGVRADALPSRRLPSASHLNVDIASSSPLFIQPSIICHPFHHITCHRHATIKDEAVLLDSSLRSFPCLRRRQHEVTSVALLVGSLCLLFSALHASAVHSPLLIMASVIHYKFKAVKGGGWDQLQFDGSSMTLAQLRSAIVEAKKLNKQSSGDFELVLQNAQTLEGKTTLSTRSLLAATCAVSLSRRISSSALLLFSSLQTTRLRTCRFPRTAASSCAVCPAPRLGLSWPTLRTSHSTHYTRCSPCGCCCCCRCPATDG
jgi:hypothetical protein